MKPCTFENKKRSKTSIFSKTRIDTDASSRHSEDLFASREITTEISTKVNNLFKINLNYTFLKGPT